MKFILNDLLGVSCFIINLFIIFFFKAEMLGQRLKTIYAISQIVSLFGFVGRAAS